MANVLTLMRIALVVPFCLVFMANVPWNLTAALIIFVIAAATDFFDGYIARARNEVSALGAALDPLADKLLITAALILLSRNGVIYGAHIFAPLIIILREMLVSGLREAVSLRGEKLPVVGLAKVKTAVQLVATAALLASAPTGIIGPSLLPIATGLLWLAAALTLITGARYTAHAVRILRANDQRDIASQ